MSSEIATKNGLPFAQEVRKRLRVYAPEIAEATNITLSHWRKVETGAANCNMQVADRAAEYMSCTVDELRHGVADPRRMKTIEVNHLRKRLAVAEGELAEMGGGQ